MTTNVFISTVGQELCSARFLVASALSSSGFGPVWCEYPDHSREDHIPSTRATIDRCNALIQIVGDSYGPEPSEVPPPFFGRVSYAQYEVLYAIQSRKPVFFLLAGPHLPRDLEAVVVDNQLARTQEDLDAWRSCQRIYREKCAALGQNVSMIESLHEIGPKVLAAIQRLPDLFTSDLLSLLGTVQVLSHDTRGNSVVFIPGVGAFETTSPRREDVFNAPDDLIRDSGHIKLVDSPGIGSASANSTDSNPIPDHASWKRRVIMSAKTRGDSRNISEERKRIRQQIDESRISAENLLRSFPSECVSAVDHIPGRISVLEVEKVIHAAEQKLESHLQTVVRNSIGSNADHLTYTTVLATDQSARINVGTAAGAAIGSVLLPGLGGIIGTMIGGLLGGMMTATSATGLKESVGKRATEFVRQLEVEVQRLLSQIERDRLYQLANNQSSSENDDEVEVSVFSEEQVQPGSQTLIQVFVHPKSDREVVAEEAARRDDSSAYRGRHALAVDVACGTLIELHLTANGFVIEEPIQSRTWQGQMECLSFVTIVPKNAQLGKIICTLTVRVLDIPVGYIRFTVTVVEAPTAARPLLVGDVAHRYGRAFISYASNDLNEVLKRVQMLRVQRIEFFQDFLTLKPGEKWEARIYQEIESSDLFLLFWSSAALASEWVEREWRHAIKCRGADDSNPPDIHPVIIEGPPVPEPPEELKRFHFRDFLACLSQYEKK